MLICYTHIEDSPNTRDIQPEEEEDKADNNDVSSLQLFCDFLHANLHNASIYYNELEWYRPSKIDNFTIAGVRFSLLRPIVQFWQQNKLLSNGSGSFAPRHWLQLGAVFILQNAAGFNLQNKGNHIF